MNKVSSRIHHIVCNTEYMLRGKVKHEDMLQSQFASKQTNITFYFQFDIENYALQKVYYQGDMPDLTLAYLETMIKFILHKNLLDSKNWPDAREIENYLRDENNVVAFDLAELDQFVFRSIIAHMIHHLLLSAYLRSTISSKKIHQQDYLHYADSVYAVFDYINQGTTQSHLGIKVDYIDENKILWAINKHGHTQYSPLVEALDSFTNFAQKNYLQRIPKI